MGFAIYVMRIENGVSTKMNQVLIVVDETRASKSVVSTFRNLVRPPERVVLLYAQKVEGGSLMTDMLGDAEMSTLREGLEGTAYKEKMDSKAEMVLDYYKKELENGGTVGIKTIIRAGHPAEEILKAADEEGAGLIILGFSEERGLNRLITGNVSRDVRERAKVPVLVAKRANICEEPYTWRDAFAAISVASSVVFGLYLLGIVLQRGTFLH